MTNVESQKSRKHSNTSDNQSPKRALRVRIFHRLGRSRKMEAAAANNDDSTDQLEADHHGSRLTVSPVLNRWGSITSQESYKGPSSRLEHELRKCLGSDYDEEVLLKSYSCAWQKDILVHGRLYITQHWFCFYSNILGFETKTSISCFDVTAVRKSKTAKLIPNAIQIETGGKKYGFSSFYHRDKTYLVLITIWQNALTQPPLSVDSLRQELKTLKVSKEQEKLIMGRRSKSASITSDGSLDYDSATAVGVADIPSPVHPNHSSSDTVTYPTEDSDIDGRVEPPCGRHTPCSTSSSHSESLTGDDSVKRSGSDHDSYSLRTLDSDKDSTSEADEEREEMDSNHKGVVKSQVPRSPSLDTLHSEAEGGGVAKGGGSPSLIHHWKHTWNFSSSWKRVTLIRPIQLVRKPIRIISMCNTSQLINLFISIAIVFMLVFMLTMFCHLSQVNPALQPYRKYQPWCALCSDYPVTAQAREQLSVLSSLLFPNTGGNDARPPIPSVLPNT